MLNTERYTIQVYSLNMGFPSLVPRLSLPTHKLKPYCRWQKAEWGLETTLAFSIWGPHSECYTMYHRMRIVFFFDMKFLLYLQLDSCHENFICKLIILLHCVCAHPPATLAASAKIFSRIISLMHSNRASGNVFTTKISGPMVDTQWHIKILLWLSMCTYI